MASAMFREAAEAPAAVERQLAANGGTVRALVRRLKAAPPRAVVTVARGSSDNAATYARYLIETRLGLLTASAAPDGLELVSFGNALSAKGVNGEMAQRALYAYRRSMGNKC